MGNPGLLRATIVLVIALPVSLVSCVSPEQMAQSYPQAGTPAAQLYFTQCSFCHSAPHPKRHHKGEWGFYVELMQKHMKDKNIPTLTDLEKKAILDYLKRNAKS